ncbi:hypothetical protein [Actinomadura sp. WMMB 499]|uniref:hypothetical protein n=1 Tax=Actinomadura sp. WMMB 499 TaxID=1219491 RepID=UPI001246A1A0|nr:hypothetical protein [Actinomadura sp. WMMB 499]QFG20709.1 hypothetical protein F7P10_05655 [Actinomadura sp. WMMB 499]
MDRRVRVAVVAAAVGLGLAGCGGGEGATAAPSESMAAEDAQLEFARCMRENGVDVPDPGTGDGGETRFGKDVDRGRLERALEKCQSWLQAGGVLPDLADPEVRDRYVKFAQCMREHGVDVPDPGPDGRLELPTGAVGQGRAEKAREACGDLLPGTGR